MSIASPLVDFFKRGEVARDVRVLAAQGVLAPRAHEQLAILIILLEDGDPEIRETAAATLDRIPEESLKTFLARSDVSIDMREFFADRGVFPAEIPSLEVDEPLIDESGGEEPEEGESPESTMQRLAKMNFPEKLRMAVKGNKEMRAILIRDNNKLISATVMSSPKLTEQEVAGFARMANIPEDVLRMIGSNRSWLKNYNIVLGLAKNPKTPVAMSLNLMNRLNPKDLQMISIDRNVPEPLRIAARKKVVQNRG